MIHEALFYLWNCPGDLFKLNGEEAWLNMIEFKEFLHPGERKLLQRIMNIALDYHHIEEFIKLVNNLHTVTSTDHVGDGTVKCIEEYNLKPGLYLKAFCNGLDEVLEQYRKEIINLEDTFLKNPQLTLTFALGCVEKYVTLFEALKSMIRVIKTEEIHGCRLIGRLHQYVNCGVPSVALAAKKIILSINSVFYKHLCNWIIYGDLVDIYGEFFICDAQCADENFLYLKRKDSETVNESICDAFGRHRIKKPPQVHKFFIKYKMLSSNISPETAEIILFMGSIVYLVRNDPKQIREDKYELQFKRDIWGGQDIEYYHKLQELGNQPFYSAAFDKTIEECRLKLTKYLWTLMVEEANFLDHLQWIRDYYALGRGELFEQFIILAERYLKETPTDYVISNLNYIFLETARKIYSEHDTSYLRFELTLPPNQASNKEVINPWTRLEINFDIQWPLHIIFHPKAVAYYNKLFCFLLRVKKTQIDLNKLWLLHMEGKKKIDPGVWTLRNNLMFIVNNLQYYLQVDVIEAEFSLFKNAVKKASEVEDILRSHSKFLSNLLSKTFIMTRNAASQHDRQHKLYQLPEFDTDNDNIVHKAILQILSLCDLFCTMVSQWNFKLTALEHDDLRNLQNQFDDLIETLLRVLYTLYGKASGHHLLQLLFRLDFNRWFSKKTDFNLTVL